MIVSRLLLNECPSNQKTFNLKSFPGKFDYLLKKENIDDVVKKSILISLLEANDNSSKQFSSVAQYSK